MEEKTDKVVGYIEYLGAGGMIGEIVPYTSVEKFKDEILDSLDCGRPVTPVVFSDELDEPLQFDSDTYFPWGFRSEKRVQIPYEIYQTNRRDLVFMEYSPARLAAGAKDYELVYKGQMERWETLDSIYSRHNRDDRPNAKSMRSVSVSDIIVTHKDNETHAFYSACRICNVGQLIQIVADGRQLLAQLVVAVGWCGFDSAPLHQRTNKRLHFHARNFALSF